MSWVRLARDFDHVGHPSTVEFKAGMRVDRPAEAVAAALANGAAEPIGSPIFAHAAELVRDPYWQGDIDGAGPGIPKGAGHERPYQGAAS